MAKRRNWCFTSYAIPDEVGDGFQMPDGHEHFRYGVMQLEECPRNGRLHYQGYLEFTAPKTMDQVKAMCTDGAMHLEPRNGTAQQARAYCMKADSRMAGTQPMEFGTVPVGGNQGARSDLADMYGKIRAGASTTSIADEHPGSYMRYYKAVAHVKQLAVVDKPTRTQDLQVCLFIGKPGTGKTRAAYQFATDTETPIWAVPIRAGKTLWFDNYQGEPVVLLDDFSGNIALDQLLRLIDRYPVQVEVKGAHIWWCPNYIFITTNVHPKTWYNYTTRTDSMAALKRRITFVMDFDAEMEPNGRPTRQDTLDWWPNENVFDVMEGEYVRRVPPRRKEDGDQEY